MADVNIKVNIEPVLDENKLNSYKAKIKDALQTEGVVITPQIKLEQITKEMNSLKGQLGQAAKLGIDDTEMRAKFEKLKAEKISIKAELDEETIGKQAEKIPEVINEKLQKGMKGIDIGKVFNAQILAGAVNELGNTFTSLTQPFVQYEKQLADLSAITGVSGGALDDLGEKARSLALRFGGEATSQIESFKGILSRLGPDIAKSPEALNKMSEAINIMSKASGLGAAESMDALTTSALQFGVDLSDPLKAAEAMTKQMNVLAAGAKFGAAEIPQVSEAVKVAGVAAYGSNISFEEMNAAIQAMATGGKFGSEAGTALRNVIGKLQDQSGEGAKALKGMGLSVEQLGEMLTKKGLSETLKVLQAGINTLGSDAQKNATMMTLFGTENAAAATIMLRNADSIKTMTGQLTGTNTGFEQAAINMDTIAAKSERFKARITDMAVSFGKSIGSIGIGAAGTLVETSKVLSSALQIKSIIPTELVDSAKTGMSKILSTLIPGFMTLNTATAASGAVATTTSFSFSALWTAITGPVGIVIGVIAAVGAGLYLLYQNSEDFRNAVNGLFDGIKNVAIGIWDGLVNGFNAAWNLLKAGFDAVYPYVAGTVGVAFVGLQLVLGGIWEVMKLLGSFVAGIFNFAWKNLVGTFNDVVSVVSGAYNWFMNLFSSTEKSGEGMSTFKTILMFMAPPFAILIELIQRAGDGFKRAGDLATFTKGILAGLSSAFEVFKVAITNMWDALVSFDIGKLKDSLTGLGGKIVEGFNKGFDATIAEKQAKDAADAVKKVAENANKEAEKAETKAAETSKAKSKDKEKSKQVDILETLKVQEKTSTQLLKELELETKLQNAKSGQKKTKEDELFAEAQKNIELQKQFNILEKIIAKTGSKIEDGKIEFAANMKADTKEKLKEAFEKLNNNLAESEISIITLSSEIDEKDFKEKYESAKVEIESKKITINAEIKAGKAFDFQASKLDIESLKLELEKANNELANAQSKESKTQLLARENSIKELNNKIVDAEKKYNSDLAKYNLTLIDDVNKQELALKQIAIEEAYNKEKIAAQGNATLELIANQKKNDALEKANQEYWNKTATFSQKASKDLSENLISAFSNITFEFPKVDLGNVNKEFDETTKNLQKGLAENTITYAEYSKQYAEADKKRNKALSNDNNQWLVIQKTANNAMIKAFDSFSKKYEKDNADLFKKMISEKENYQKYENEYYNNALIIQGSAFAQMLIDGQNFWDSMAVAAIGFLRTMIPVWGAQLFGKEAASFTGLPGAIAQYAAFNIVMQGLLAAAEAAVKRGEGGKVYGNEQLVRMNEYGEEFVVNHIATAKNLAALNVINRDNLSIDEYANRYLPANTQSVNFDLFVQSNRELRQDIGILNNSVKDLKRSFSHKTSLDVQVKSDPNRIYDLHIQQSKRDLAKW
jgi:TP901 family phage tail tape measure protein